MRDRRAVQLLLCAALADAACAIEKTAATITEHEVTSSPSSSGDSGDIDTSTSTSTSTSTGTSTSEVASSETDGNSGTPGSTSTSEAETHAAPDGSTSTGPVGPVCGDGIVEGDESCDDGNATPDDGCQECAKDSIVFITSESYQGYALDGLYGADQRCRSLAAKANLQRPLTFRAWASAPRRCPPQIACYTPGPVHSDKRARGRAKLGRADLGALQNPIVVDENSQTKEDYVWTGSLPDGQPALGSDFCGEWREEMDFHAVRRRGPEPGDRRKMVIRRSRHNVALRAASIVSSSETRL